MHKLSLFFALLIFVLAVATPALTAVAQNQPALSADRIQTQIDSLENQISNLLLNIPAGSSSQISAPAIEETYRLIDRWLYLSALNTNHNQLRVLLTLKADQLEVSLPEFDALINKILPANAQPPANILAALQNFQNTGQNVEHHFRDPSDVYAYLDKMLSSLEPLVSVESSNVNLDSVVVWPVSPSNQNENSESGGLPSIDQELIAVSQSNLLPQMRDAIESVLKQLKPGLTDPDTRDQNMSYYRTILDCTQLAQHLQDSSVLNIADQEQFSNTLLQGLLFFKDPRLRDAAVQRLGSVGLIVHSLELLQQTPLTSGQSDLLSAQVHDLIAGLSDPGQAQQNIQALHNIDSLLTQYNNLESKTVPPNIDYLTRPWQRCLDAGQMIFPNAIGPGNFKDRISIPVATDVLKIINANLDRLAAMPQAREQALFYNPIPEEGVEENLTLWAGLIGNSPAANNVGAANFDRFQTVLQLLARTHLDFEQKIPDDLLAQMTSNRYKQFVQVFLQTQRDLINSLAVPRAAPQNMIDQLQRQELVFHTTWELAGFLGPDRRFETLNTWGAWHTTGTAARLLLDQFEQALAGEYRNQTRMNSGSDAWISFDDAAPAIHALFLTYGKLSPKLNADPSLWSTRLLQVCEPPPDNALFADDLDDFALASELFNDAGYYHRTGQDQSATAPFQSALHTLSSIQNEP